jgi:hypothetical protein
MGAMAIATLAGARLESIAGRGAASEAVVAGYRSGDDIVLGGRDPGGFRCFC